jgi:hypothetical protein
MAERPTNETLDFSKPEGHWRASILQTITYGTTAQPIITLSIFTKRLGGSTLCHRI